MDNFSLCNSFDESCIAYTSSIIHFSSPPQKSSSPNIAQDHNIDKRFALFTWSSLYLTFKLKIDTWYAPWSWTTRLVKIFL